MPEVARRLSSELVPVLPADVVAGAKLGHLVVFNETLVAPLLDADREFYHRSAGESVSGPVFRAVKTGGCGELLGYGSRQMFGLGQVRVRLWDGVRLLAGFYAPQARAEEFAAARAFDYQDYLAREIRITIG